MDEIWQKIIAGAIGSGLPTLMLLYAVKWLQSGNQKMVEQLNTERQDHLTVLGAHIAECDADRKELRNRLIDMLSHPKPAGTP